MSSGTTWHLGLYCQNALCVCWKRKERTNFYAPLIRSLCNYPLIYCYLISQQPEEHTHTTLYYFPSFPLYTNRICIFWHSLFIWHDDDNYTPLSVQLQLVLMLLLLLSFPFFFFLSYILLPLPFIPLQQLPQNEKILIPIFFLKKPKKKKLTHYNLLLTTYMFIYEKRLLLLLLHFLWENEMNTRRDQLTTKTFFM